MLNFGIIHQNISVAIGTSNHVFLTEEEYCSIEFAGRCFRYFHNIVSWENAKEMCTSLGRHLVSVRNAGENEIIKAFIHKEDPSCEPQVFPWIGLFHDRTTSWDDSKWSDASSVRYINWRGNEPSNYAV